MPLHLAPTAEEAAREMDCVYEALFENGLAGAVRDRLWIDHILVLLTATAEAAARLERGAEPPAPLPVLLAETLSDYLHPRIVPYLLAAAREAGQ